jgi:hypothetical protein
VQDFFWGKGRGGGAGVRGARGLEGAPGLDHEFTAVRAGGGGGGRGLGLYRAQVHAWVLVACGENVTQREFLGRV